MIKPSVDPRWQSAGEPRRYLIFMSHITPDLTLTWKTST
jgi:hypothetical protein